MRVDLDRNKIYHIAIPDVVFKLAEDSDSDDSSVSTDDDT